MNNIEELLETITRVNTYSKDEFNELYIKSENELLSIYNDLALNKRYISLCDIVEVVNKRASNDINYVNSIDIAGISQMIKYPEQLSKLISKSANVSWFYKFGNMFNKPIFYIPSNKRIINTITGIPLLKKYYKSIIFTTGIVILTSIFIMNTEILNTLQQNLMIGFSLLALFKYISELNKIAKVYV